MSTHTIEQIEAALARADRLAAIRRDDALVIPIPSDEATIVLAAALREAREREKRLREVYPLIRPMLLENEYPIPGLTDDEEKQLRDAWAVFEAAFAPADEAKP